ncbi:MAG: FAD-dependent oxidoreductase, partial [Micromonosporaceae bacterium]
MNVVVVGYGMAGARVTDELLRRGAAVTVLAEEPHPAYNRILLSALLADGEKDVSLRVRDGADVRLGVAAASIDPAAGTVTATDGTVLDYDALVLATGSQPWLPPVTGVEDGIVFRTLDDCRRIVARAAGARRAV